MLITIKNLNKRHADRLILKDAQMIINDQDKIGIIGKNGAGKSTLLKMIAGIEQMDSGDYITGGNIKISYLKQMPDFLDGQTCFSFISSQLKEKDKVNDYEIKAILSKLGINDYDQQISQLSGGQKKRVALALALLLPSDLLLLDEPTNHLDQDMILWLEKYLIKYTGAIAMVTHDRYFLERVCNKMIEIDRCGLFTYQANYSAYLEQKELTQAQQIASDHKRQQFLKKELEWVRAGVQARSTKSKSRLDRFEKLSQVASVSQDKEFDLSSIASRLGSKTIELKDITYQLDDRLLINHFSYLFLRHDRVGIIGANGIGKSTLLNIIAQIKQPTAGEVILGDTINIGYFSQEIQGIDESKRVIDIIRDYAEHFQTSDGQLSATQLLEQFLFEKEKQYTVVNRLSGGEKRRLFLLTVLLKQPNVLILDEPTNDFDIPTLNVLEDFLDQFSGIVITVSHDRYFLDRVVDQIFAFEENGIIQRYMGGFSDYLEKKTMHQETMKETKKKIAKKISSVKMTYQEKKEFESIETDISNLENQLAEIEKEMNEFHEDYTKIIELTKKQELLENALEEKMERWEYLSELNEKVMQAH